MIQMRRLVLQTVDRHRDVFSKGAVLWHTKNGVLIRLYLRVGTPVDIGIYHHLLSYPGLMHFIVHRFYNPASVRTKYGSNPDVQLLTLDDPLIAPVYRNR